MASGVRFWVTDREIERVRAAFPASAPIDHLWPLIEGAPTTPVPPRDYADADARPTSVRRDPAAPVSGP